MATTDTKKIKIERIIFFKDGELYDDKIWIWVGTHCLGTIPVEYVPELMHKLSEKLKINI